MQVHTINLIFPIGEHDIHFLKNRHLIEISQVNEFQFDYNFATFSIYRKPNGRYYLSIVIDCILLLEKVHMLDTDYFLIEQSTRAILLRMFGHDKHFESHILKRIDYKFDAYVPKEDDRRLLLVLYKKLTKSFRHQKMKDGVVKGNKEFRVYELKNGTISKDEVDEILESDDDNDEEFRPYETTVYHLSKSIRVVVYDKEVERNVKSATILPHEEGVLRYEIAVLQKHINYRRNEKECPNPVEPKLRNYFKEKMWKAYFSDYLNPIYLSGDYYKISEAKKIINNSSERPSMKKKLIEFLSMISRGNIDTPKKNGMHPKTINSRHAKLRDLGINPILIPQNRKNAPSRLNNPLKKFYSV